MAPLLRQLFDAATWTYTYLLADPDTKEAVLIDPVLEQVRCFSASDRSLPARQLMGKVTESRSHPQVDRDLQLVDQLGLKLLYGINTRERLLLTLRRSPPRRRLLIRWRAPCRLSRRSYHGHGPYQGAPPQLGLGRAGRPAHAQETDPGLPAPPPQSLRPEVKSVIAQAAGAAGDVYVQHGDTVRFGGYALECRATPGHTNGCMTFYLAEPGWVFTGDALLIRSCGRTDFQQGGRAGGAGGVAGSAAGRLRAWARSRCWQPPGRLGRCAFVGACPDVRGSQPFSCEPAAARMGQLQNSRRHCCGRLFSTPRVQHDRIASSKPAHPRPLTVSPCPAPPPPPPGDPSNLHDSVHAQIFTLPGDTLVYPGHDYKGFTCSSVAEEAAHNPRLTKDKQAFVELMANLGLPYPKQIDRALPANLADGAGL
jgi:glyoxylase-like metal-dependent hydrolase (beta-lactamase superfamily II)